MPAVDTAMRVLHWAVRPEGRPPTGDARGLLDVLALPPALAAALAHLAAVTAARLGLAGLPGPPGDSGAGPSLGAALLALAIGLRERPEAAEILRCCPDATGLWPEGAWDLIARHGVVAPARAVLGTGLGDDLLAAAPLTGLLAAPVEGARDRTLVLGQSLAGVRELRQPVVAAFADSSATTAELEWRSFALGRLALEPATCAFVLDVYETAVAWYGEPWRERIGLGFRTLAAPSPPDAAWRTALALGRWWRPLARLRRSRHDALRARSYLDFRIYWEGLRLADTVAQLEAAQGAA